jgi:hypothetical protein
MLRAPRDRDEKGNTLKTELFMSRVVCSIVLSRLAASSSKDGALRALNIRW